MPSASSLPYVRGGSPSTQTQPDRDSPGQRPPSPDRDPLDRAPPVDKPPWTGSDIIQRLPCGQIDACKNITLPQTSLRAVQIITSGSFLFRPSAICKWSFVYKDSLLADILSTLKDSTRDQLRLLIRVGFCVNNSPVTFISESKGGAPNITICHGATTPDNTLVFHHVPTRQEVEQQTLKLQKILSLIPKPKHVTVCRSFRDGYVPKDLFPQIERNILSSIRKAFPSYSSVHYDTNLLGGSRGWSARQRVKYKRKNRQKVKQKRKKYTKISSVQWAKMKTRLPETKWPSPVNFHLTLTERCPFANVSFEPEKKYVLNQNFLPSHLILHTSWRI